MLGITRILKIFFGPFRVRGSFCKRTIAYANDSRYYYSVLSCQHTYCEECLASYVKTVPEFSSELPCPECRLYCPLPAGGVTSLPDNFFVQSLSELVLRRTRRCDNCVKEGAARQSLRHCTHCMLSLCSTCADSHTTETAHKLLPMTTNKTSTNISDDVTSALYCSTHAEASATAFCGSCKVPVCDNRYVPTTNFPVVKTFVEAVTLTKMTATT